MKQILITLSALILSFSFSSCLFSPSIKGNGNVVKKERVVDDFDEIKVSRGMNVYISQSDKTTVVVKADENLHEVIETKVEGDALEIKSNTNIKHAKENKVFVTTPDIEVIKAFAGSNAYSETVIQGETIAITASAGSNMNIELNVSELETKATAGSNIILRGNTKAALMKASAGSNIKAGELKATLVEAKVSSGSNIWICSEDKLQGNASSGGNIFYSGNPENTEVHKSSGGNVIKN